MPARSSTPVLDRLRAATAAAHSDLENNLQAIERLSALDDRRAMAPRYYAMHASGEEAVARWLSAAPDLDLAARKRIPILSEDLKALGLAPPAARAWPDLQAASAAEALGLLYVLEGSTLGGRMIHKALLARGCDLTGLSFLDPYGSATAERWRSFLAVLERDGAVDPEGVERGAVAGFRHARRCLVESPPR